MSKKATILKLEILVADLHDTVIRLKNYSDTHLPAIEIGLIEQKLITFYDEIQTLKSNSARQLFSQSEEVKTQKTVVIESEPENNVAEIRAQFESLKQQFAKNIESEKAEVSMPFYLETNEIADDILEDNVDHEIEGLMNMAAQELELEIEEKPIEKKTEAIALKNLEERVQQAPISDKPIDAVALNSAEKTPQIEKPLIQKARQETQKAEKTDEIEHKDHKTINQSNSEILEKRTSLNDRFNGPKQPSLHEKLAMQKDSKAQLSKQMAGKPIKDIKKAINLNLQIRFQKELFDNDNRAFKRAIDFLNKCNTYSEARTYIQHDLAKNFKNWDEENLQYQEFMGIIKRRFI